MTDRELLELAAKAAELPECGWMGPAFMYVKDNQFKDWNPLTDDGDALRLAVKLRMDVVSFSHGVRVDATAFVDCYEPYNANPYAVTRRAVVRAAAEVGKGMK